jgi:hypothetical protein
LSGAPGAPLALELSTPAAIFFSIPFKISITLSPGLVDVRSRQGGVGLGRSANSSTSESSAMLMSVKCNTAEPRRCMQQGEARRGCGRPPGGARQEIAGGVRGRLQSFHQCWSDQAALTAVFRSYSSCPATRWPLGLLGEIRLGLLKGPWRLHAYHQLFGRSALRPGRSPLDPLPSFCALLLAPSDPCRPSKWHSCDPFSRVSRRAAFASPDSDGAEASVGGGEDADELRA